VYPSHKEDIVNLETTVSLEAYSARLDSFLARCHELEASNVWDVDEHGFMSAYFESDLFSVALQLMSADGTFESAEAEVLNAMFSTSYTSRDLRKMYVSLKPVVDDYCDADAQDALHVLEGIDGSLASEYRRLILGACDVISRADGVAEGTETRLIRRLRATLEG
jgi:uncharacterized tellurite resistance protein B-like protein